IRWQERSRGMRVASQTAEASRSIVNPYLAAGPRGGYAALHREIRAAPLDAIEISHIKRGKREQPVQRTHNRDGVWRSRKWAFKRPIAGAVAACGSDSHASAYIDHRDNVHGLFSHCSGGVPRSIAF